MPPTRDTCQSCGKAKQGVKNGRCIACTNKYLRGEQQAQRREQSRDRARLDLNLPHPTQQAGRGPARQPVQAGGAPPSGGAMDGATVADLVVAGVSIRELQDKNARGEMSMQDFFSVFLGSLQTNIQISQRVEALEDRTEDVEERVTRLELMTGGADAIPEQVGLVAKNIPKEIGKTDLELARDLITACNAPGVNAAVDIVRAVRKGAKEESNPGANDGYHGTILIQVASKEKVALIMKNKNNNLKNSARFKDIRLANMKSQLQMNFENSTRQLLKMVPGGEQWQLAGNGQLRKKNNDGNSRNNQNNPNDGNSRNNTNGGNDRNNLQQQAPVIQN